MKTENMKNTLSNFIPKRVAAIAKMKIIIYVSLINKLIRSQNEKEKL